MIDVKRNEPVVINYVPNPDAVRNIVRITIEKTEEDEKNNTVSVHVDEEIKKGYLNNNAGDDTIAKASAKALADKLFKP